MSAPHSARSPYYLISSLVKTTRKDFLDAMLQSYEGALMCKIRSIISLTCLKEGNIYCSDDECVFGAFQPTHAVVITEC